MKVPPIDAINDMTRILEKWDSEGAEVSDMLERLATTTMLVCVNTATPRKALSIYIDLLQNIEENPNYDEVVKCFSPAED